MGYDGPKVFLAPFGNDAARENFQRTVLDGVDQDLVSSHADSIPDTDPVRLWGTKDTVSGSWRKIDPGDYLIFYRDGTYEYAAEVVRTERNEALGREVWPNHEEGSPWVCIIYLEEPVRIDVDSAIVHDLAGHDISYTMGFSTLNEMGIGGLRGRYGSIEAFAEGGDPVEVDGQPASPDIDVESEPTVSLTEALFDGLYYPDDQRTDVLEQVNSALNAGKHIVFTGPPGTGKTELARRVADRLSSEHGGIYSGYQVTTATADWSTFETVGGYMPEEGDGDDLAFEPGQVLRRFKRGGTQRNEPLVIDEINRADIDKAFGQLFTLLSGQAVQLPFKRGGEEIEVVPASESDGDLPENRYVMPESWRLLATMNSYDKTSLYEMSYAFMRRFAFVHVAAPDVDRASAGDLVEEYASVWEVDASDAELDAVGRVWHITNSVVDERKLGPAIVGDVLSHVTDSPVSLERALTQAVANYVFPQLEGVPRREKIVAELARLDDLDGDRIRRLGADVLGVRVDETV